MKYFIHYFLINLILCIAASANNPWSSYKLIHEKCEAIFFDPAFVNGTCSTGKINRTSMAMNFSVESYMDQPEDLMVHVIGYEFKSNEYRRSMVEIKRNLCDYFHNEHKFLFPHTFEKCTCTFRECPLKKGSIKCVNWIADRNAIRLIPFGQKWMFKAVLKTPKKVYFESKMYVRLEEIAKYKGAL